MKKILAISWSLLLISVSFLTAQNVMLNGQISIHNSGYETGKIKYVQDAYVSAAFAGTVDTDVNGKFNLIFSGIDKGTAVEVNVEKADLELVNKKKLQDVIIGRLRPLKIYLAPKGQIAKAQTELYDISLAAITAKHDALIAELRKVGGKSRIIINQLEQQLNRKIADRFEAERMLFENLEAAKKRLPESVKKLVNVNLDFASENYRLAYQTYQSGAIEEAIAILDKVQLADQVSDALSSIEQIKLDKIDYQLALEQAEEQVNQIVQTYTLKAEAYHLIFDYRAAVKVYSKVVNLLEQVKAEVDLELANAYQSMGTFNRGFGDYKNSIHYYQKCVEAKERIYATDNQQDLLESYNDLANAYSLFGDHKNSSKLQLKVLLLLDTRSSVDLQFLCAIQTGLGVSYRNLGKYDESISLLKSAMVVLEKGYDKIEADKHNLAATYSNLALTYREAQEYEKALDLQKKALELFLEIYPSHHPEITFLYNNLTLAYLDIEKCDTSIYYASKAIEQLVNNGIETHPVMGIIYDNMASAYLCLNQLDQAKAAQSKAIVFLKEYYGAENIHTATSKMILANIYKRKQEHESEYLIYKEVYETRKKILGETHPLSILTLKNLIRASDLVAANYKQKAQLKEAISFESESINKLHYLFGIEKPNKTDSIQMANKYYFLANLYQESNQLDSALHIALTCAEWRELILDPFHNNIALTHSFIAMVYVNNPEFKILHSLPHLLKAYTIWSKTRKPDDYSLTAMKNSLFLVYSAKGLDAEKASEYQEAAQNFREALKYVYSEADNKDYKTSMLNGYSKEDLPLKIAICSYHAKDFPSALEYFEMAYNRGHINEVSYLYLSALCYAKTKKLEKTKQHFEKIEEMLPDQGIVFRNWALYFAFLDQDEQILSSLEKAFNLGYKDWQWIEDEKNFDSVRQHPRYQKVIQNMKAQQ